MIPVLLRLYRLALRVLAPSDLRAEYGEQIELLFEELLEEARREGSRAVVRAWLREVRQLSGMVRLLSDDPAASRRWPPRRAISALADALRDLKRSLMVLRTRPAYVAACVFTLAVGLGLTAAVHSVARVSVLGTIPVPESNRVVVVRGVVNTAQWRGQTALSAPELLSLAEEATSFQEVALFSLAGTATLVSEAHAQRLRVDYVSPNLFRVLRARPALGRFFNDAANPTARVAEVVLAHHVWAERFGADPEILGTTISLSGTPVEVVGVARAEQVGVRTAGGLDAWLPLGLAPELAGPAAGLDSPGNAMYWAVARLMDGVSHRQAEEEVGRLHDAFSKNNPLGDSRRAGIMDLREHFFGGVERPFVAVSILALLVLLACAFNLVSMARLRSRERERELALRATLGASRLRVACTAAGEGLVLAGAGTALALVVAQMALGLFEATVGPQLVTFGAVGLDVPQLLAVAGVLAVAFTAPSVRAVLHRSGRVPRGGPVPSYLKSTAWVIALETALAVVVLVPALLTGMSLGRLQQVDLGYEPAGLDAVRVNLAGTRHADYWGPARFVERVHRRLTPGSPPGSVGLMGPDMMGRAVTHIRVVPGGADPTREENVVRLQWTSVTPGTLSTLGIERVAGRDVAWSDEPGSELAIVLNERAAERLWPGESPLGKALHVAGAKRPNGVVVGMVRDARHVGRASTPYVEGDAYLAFSQRPTPWVTLLYRRGPEMTPGFAILREAITEVEPLAAPFGETSMASVLRSEESPARLILTLTSAYALIAVLLSAIGMTSVLGTAVRERRQELAIRAALGASSPFLVWLLARRMLLAVAGGLVVGSAVSLATMPALSPILFEVSATDPRVYAKVMSVVMLLAGIALSLPGLETIRIPPAESIRNS